MTERLFFALWPGSKQRLALARVQSDLPGPKGKETRPENFHITLVFLGETDAERQACVEAAAGRVHSAPFELSLGRIDCFPRAHVRWCGTDSLPSPLLELVGSLGRGLLACGFTPERRSLRPHVTLARKAPRLESRGLDAPIPWPAEEFVLAAGPPPYRILRRWTLSG